MHVHYLEHTTSVEEKRETSESHGVFMSPLGRDTYDTTHISLARMSHWELEKSYLRSIIVDGTSLIAMLSVFFLPW